MMEARDPQHLGPGRRMIRGLVWIGLITITAAGWIAWGPGSVPVAAIGLPKLVITPLRVDLGTIQKTGGKAAATFTLRNDGKAPLRIQRIVPT